ncbi:outer membrane beta-barrel protein [Saccharicrinis aurantiacus]|uniref:outer membrane beta-barrel protein n=1 Tax=Saccharicrinis aurantiacus TaxID=1849719 RepID=UPI00094FB2E7|nr:outer membrane beta-barrel protein [Saccharicrinis aurantiacus]
MKNKRIITVLIMSIGLIISVNAQNHHQTNTKSEHHHESTNLIHAEHGKHKIAAYGGFTHISAAFYEHETHVESTGKWVPTFGIEYYYKLNHHFEVGFIGDVELDQYYIRTTHEEELERNNVLVVAAVVRYSPINRLGVFLGPGYETEFVGKSDATSFFVAKLGIDYEIEIENGWELTPIFSYDIKEEYSAYSFGVSLGKRF